MGRRSTERVMSSPADCSQPTAHRLQGAEGGALMAVASMSCVQLALALSVRMFDQLGPLGVAGLRLVWAGLLMLLLVRPRPGDFTARDLRACCALGVVTAGLMLFFMIAIARIPLATASALEFLGPLIVSIYGPGSGRKRWAVMAGAGVVLLTQAWHGGIDPVGVALGLAAGACWGSYILLTQHVGDRVTGLSGLAVSLPVAGACAALVVLLVDGPSELGRVTWHALVIMLALAALHPVLTFSLEYLSLRGLTAKAFATLMCVEPAIAILAGLLVLGQIPSIASAIGVLFVVIAGIGAIRTGARPPAQREDDIGTHCGPVG
jgi:inner membrane transporter RhtA